MLCLLDSEMFQDCTSSSEIFDKAFSSVITQNIQFKKKTDLNNKPVFKTTNFDCKDYSCLNKGNLVSYYALVHFLYLVITS